MPDLNDFETIADMDALERAEKIRNDPSRLARIQRFAKEQHDRANKLAPRQENRGFNGAVKGSNRKR